MKKILVGMSVLVLAGWSLPCAAAGGRLPGFIAIPQLVPGFAVEQYTLQPGDTVSELAQSRGLAMDTLLSFNRIQSPRFLRAGQVIGIPPMDGILISLAEPTAVSQLIREYQVRLDWFTYANGSAIQAGQISGDVFLPGVKLDPEELKTIIGELLLWPTDGGWISSRFGKRNDPFTGELSSHKGLDIANYHGAPVYAAGDGTVTATGWDDVLGNYIRMNQGGGTVTVYGHLSAIKVRPGQKIVRGRLIGRVGSTGLSTGAHLHFVVYRNGRLVNPLMIFN